MLTAVAFAAALLLAQASSPPAAPAETKTKAEKPKKPKMVCTDETPAGSFISKRVCRTPEQAAAEREAAKRDTDATLDHLNACRGGPSC